MSAQSMVLLEDTLAETQETVSALFTYLLTLWNALKEERHQKDFYKQFLPPFFRMPFAGEGALPTYESVLSHCYGALLPMFTTKEATVLRQLCREFKATVADFPWEDANTVIKGSVAGWRACFPRARWASVHILRWRTPLVDADFVHFKGLWGLRMGECKRITDAAFVHLKGIRYLK